MKFSGTALETVRYYTGDRVHIFGRLDYGTGADRWIGRIMGVVTGLDGATVAVIEPDGGESFNLPVSAVREVRPAGR